MSAGWSRGVESGGRIDERTIARNVYERLLLARYAMKFIVAKVLGDGL